MTETPSFTRTSEPAVEPLTLAEAKVQLRESSSDYDAQITFLVRAARRTVENKTRRSLVTQEVTATVSRFPGGESIPLAYGPIQSIDSVTYLDADGTRLALESSLYLLDKFGRGFLTLPETGEWPSGVKEQSGSVIVICTAGYGDAASDIPADLVHAVRLMLEDFYNGPHQNGARESAAQALLATYVVRH